MYDRKISRTRGLFENEKYETLKSVLNIEYVPSWFCMFINNSTQNIQGIDSQSKFGKQLHFRHKEYMSFNFDLHV